MLKLIFSYIYILCVCILYFKYFFTYMLCIHTFYICMYVCIFTSKMARFVSTEEHLSCDSSIPLAAQELMKKMVRQFALEYASKCLLNTSTQGVTTRTSSPLSEMADAPLDLTVSRTQEKEDTQSEPGGKTI